MTVEFNPFTGNFDFVKTVESGQAAVSDLVIPWNVRNTIDSNGDQVVLVYGTDQFIMEVPY